VAHRSGTSVLTRSASSLVALVALLAATACATPDQSPDDSTMTATPQQQFQELLKRPDIEQISQRYNEMRAGISDRLSAEIGTPPWKEDADTGGSSGCGREYPDVGIDGEARAMPLWYSEAAVPDDKWTLAVQVVNEITSNYGFGAPTVVVDTPGNHEISLKGNYGAELVFGTKNQSILTVLTGCHLTPEAHRRGAPSTSR
jgi:hypothetical protein